MASVSLQAILTAIATVVVSGVSAVYGLIVARYFGAKPLESDAFFLAFSVYSGFTMFSSASRVAVVPMISSRDNDESEVRRKYAEVAVTVICLFTVIGVALTVGGHGLGRLLGSGLQTEGKRLTGALIMAFVPAVVFQGLSFFFSGVLGAHGRLDHVSKVLSVCSMVGLVCAIVALGKLGIFTIPAGFGVFHGLAALIQWSEIRRSGLRVRSEARRSVTPGLIYALVVKLLQYSSLYLAIQVSYIISQSLASHLPNGLPTAFAYAFLAGSLIVSILAGALGITLAPRLVALANSDREDFAQYIIIHTVFCSALICGVLGGLLCVSREVGAFVFSVLARGDIAKPVIEQRISAFVQMLFCLSPGMLGIAIFSILTPAALALEKTKGFLRFTLAALAAHLVISTLLLKTGGTAGISIGYSITGIVLCLFPLLKVRRIAGSGFLLKLEARLLVPAACAIVSGFLAYLVVRHMMLNSNEWLQAAMKSLVFVLAYVPLVYKLAPEGMVPLTHLTSKK